MDPLSTIASTIAIIQATSKTFEIIRTISELPAAFEEVNRQLPIVEQTLRNAKSRLRRGPDPTDAEEAIINSILSPCQEKAAKLKDIFDKLHTKCQTQNGSAPWGVVRATYRKVLAGVKAHRVESLMNEILKDTKMLACNQVFKLAMAQDLTAIEKAIENLGIAGQSLPDSEFEGAGTINAQQAVASGAHGQQNNVQGGENTFNTGQYIASGSNQNIHYVNSNSELSLPTAKDAIFGSAVDQYEPECLEGTRVDVLNDILKWVNKPHGKSLYWLNGMAGTGKSTISRTICRKLHKEGLLGASFFFKRGEGDRGNATRLFTTLADRLAVYSPTLKADIYNRMKRDPSIPTMAFAVQFRELILQPLSNSRGISRKVVIVVDALDECEGEPDQEAIIAVLALARCAYPVDLRVFLTSRPELPPRLGFGSISGKFEDCILHKVPSTDLDIDIYLRWELSKIRPRFNDWFPFPDFWPTEDDIRKLAKAAKPLFIAAATYCRFIADTRESPVDSLKILLTSTHRELDQLSKTYVPILKQLANQDDAKIKESLEYKIAESLEYDFADFMGDTESQNGLAANFRTIVGTIISLATPLSIVSLARLLSMEEATIRLTLNNLHSILDIPDINLQGGVVRAFHLSLADFLLGSHLKKSALSRFWIDSKATHENITSKCIDLMSNELNENICSLGSHGTLRSEINKTLIDQCVSIELQYACRYWTNHLIKSEQYITASTQVRDFFQKHLLHWLEVMSLLGCMFEVVPIISSVEIQIKNQILSHTSDSDSEFVFIGCREDRSFPKLLYDIKRFVLQNQTLVDRAPLQIYSSAVLFSPDSSEVKKLFKPKWIVSHHVCEVSKQPKKWGSLLQTLEGHEGLVGALAFSPDGSTIASGSNDHKIKLWNAITGRLQIILMGHTDAVTALAFSATGNTVASGSSDKTMNLWDVATGRLQKTLPNHHKSEILVLSFSPSDNKIASGSRDGTIHIYDDATCQLRYTFKGYGPIHFLCFSPSGKLIASGSPTEIRIWNIVDCQLQQHFDQMKGPISGLFFSPTGNTITSCFGNIGGEILTWDTATGRLQRTLRLDVSFPKPGTFSSSGSRYAAVNCVDWSNLIKVWDAATGTHQKTLEGHQDSISALSFSPNKNIIASGSRDGTIKLWDLTVDQRQKSYQDRISYSHSILGIAFSPNGNTIASSSATEIKLWYTSTGEHRKTLNIEPNRPDHSLAFSPSGNTIGSVVGSLGNISLKLWNVNTGGARNDLPIKLKGSLNNSVHTIMETLDDEATRPSDEYPNLNSPQNPSPMRDMLPWPHLEVQGQWIKCDGENLLWLPDSLRGPSAIHGAKVAIGSRSGAMTIIRFYFELKTS